MTGGLSVIAIHSYRIMHENEAITTVEHLEP